MSGALVISLDFELHWGIRDGGVGANEAREQVLSARAVVRELLDRFGRDGIAATWATVGFLFADCRDQRDAYLPRIRPSYRDAALDPYREPIGQSEADDPAHYARSLIDAIRATPRQEIATHTFSHYYCHDDVVGRAAFDADLESAVAIAASMGVELRSIVFPRNQVEAAYLDVLDRYGIRNFRGNPVLSNAHRGQHPLSEQATRVLRLVDAYLPLSGRQTYPYRAMADGNGLRNVRASMYLRAHYPSSGGLRNLHLQRVVQGMRHAAASGEVFHLWWHPHNFAGCPERSFAVLDEILDEFTRLRDTVGMRSLTMDEAGALSRTA